MLPESGSMLAIQRPTFYRFRAIALHAIYDVTFSALHIREVMPDLDGLATFLGGYSFSPRFKPFWAHHHPRGKTRIARLSHTCEAGLITASPLSEVSYPPSPLPSYKGAL
jgi:hypothetical protein